MSFLVTFKMFKFTNAENNCTALKKVIKLPALLASDEVLLESQNFRPKCDFFSKTTPEFNPRILSEVKT